MSATAAVVAEYWRRGHVTVPDLFSTAEMDAAIADAESWAAEVVAGLDEHDRRWYLEADGAAAKLRKLDNPVSERAHFRRLASAPALVELVEALIGPGVRVCFSQIFFKPPVVGGPKPVHQDNFYFGCDAINGLVTAWVAMDAASVENGCLQFGDGTHQGPVYPHIAPPARPFDLQLAADDAARHPMTPAPVAKGGVSFHHGNTLHQSSPNRSGNWRRAVAMHYLNRHCRLANPALVYDRDAFVAIS